MSANVVFSTQSLVKSKKEKVFVLRWRFVWPNWPGPQNMTCPGTLYFPAPGCWKTSSCNNVEAKSASQYYQRSMLLSYIDGLSSSIRERFNENPSFLRCFLSCLLTTRPKWIRLRAYSTFIKPTQSRQCN